MMPPTIRSTGRASTTACFDPATRSYEDYDWSLRFAGRYRFDTVTEELVIMHSTEGSMSQSAEDRVEMIPYLIDERPCP